MTHKKAKKYVNIVVDGNGEKVFCWEIAYIECVVVKVKYTRELGVVKKEKTVL